MASIRKTKNGSFQATIFVGRDASGKQLFKYVTCGTEKEAKAVAREIESDIELNKYTGLEKVKFCDYAAKWLERNKNHFAPTTFSSYRMYINKHFNPIIGNMRMGKITEFHIKDYISEKLDEYSPTTIRKHFFVLKEIFEECLKYKSPMVNVKPPTAGEYVPIVPTDKEFEKLCEIAKGTRHELPILLAGCCGLRRGEIFALKWNDINFNLGTITVDESVTFTDDGLKDKSTKNNKQRVVVADDHLMNLLKQKKAALKVIGLDVRILSGRPDHYSTLFNRLLKEHKLPVYRFHDLRHYHATYLYANDIPDQYAADRLGHNILVLKGVYQHLGLQKKKDIDDKIRKMYSGRLTEKKEGNQH